MCGTGGDGVEVTRGKNACGLQFGSFRTSRWLALRGCDQSSIKRASASHANRGRLATFQHELRVTFPHTFTRNT